MYNVDLIKKFNYFINNTLDEMWSVVLISYGLGDIPLTIIKDALEWNTNYAVSKDTMLDSDDLFDASMLTCCVPLVDEMNIITSVRAGVIAGMSSLLQLFVGCNLNFDIFGIILKHIMQHEAGHIMYHFEFLGRTLIEWNESGSIPSVAPKLRKNASHKSVFKNKMVYQSCFMESEADRLAGITNKTWAKDFVLVNPGYSRKQLGVEEYLTEEEFRNIVEFGKLLRK